MHAVSPPLRGSVAADKVCHHHCELPNGVQILDEGLNGECRLVETGQGQDLDPCASWPVGWQ
jgi:hypothetical protein